MAQNTSPIFSLVPVVSSAQLVNGTTGSTRSDGVGTVGTDLLKAFTANATNGSFVSKIRISPAGLVAATNTTASVIRIFISSITSGATTAANTFLFAEISTAVIAAAHSTIAVNWYELPINVALPASYTILVSIHAAPAANTQWTCLVFAGDY